MPRLCCEGCYLAFARVELLRTGAQRGSPGRCSLKTGASSSLVPKPAEARSAAMAPFVGMRPLSRLIQSWLFSNRSLMMLRQGVGLACAPAVWVPGAWRDGRVGQRGRLSARAPVSVVQMWAGRYRPSPGTAPDARGDSEPPSRVPERADLSSKPFREWTDRHAIRRACKSTPSLLNSHGRRQT
jgi:hypothetical protein